MNFAEEEIWGSGLIGFDIVEGPYIKWYHKFRENDVDIDMENFLMNFYLSFRGGDEGLQPLAILYQDFYIVAFPRGLELLCLFMDPGDLSNDIWRLNQIASELILQIEAAEENEDTSEDSFENCENVKDYDEIKRIVVSLLNQQEISTPELRRYFKLSNSEIWKIMSQLEDSNSVLRTEKRGRAQFWTAA